MTAHIASGTIRRARPEDVPQILAMVRELAEYERAADHAIATEDDLQRALFGANPAVFAHVVEIHDPENAARNLAGFAIWFLNFSTWLGQHGLYLEDLYIRPEFRGSGFGDSLLSTLARECIDNDYGRFEWWVLDWNTPALDFYRARGA
ncbi:MAG: GNAT family N-acetyltransferase, partial [Candidatus Nanopelagicales bacterium]|nr:GNAT family N-acetyltransferase [Candidatus Nanopelagicales bacterium]